MAKRCSQLSRLHAPTTLPMQLINLDSLSHGVKVIWATQVRQEVSAQCALQSTHKTEFSLMFTLMETLRFFLHQCVFMNSSRSVAHPKVALKSRLLAPASPTPTSSLFASPSLKRLLRFPAPSMKLMGPLCAPRPHLFNREMICSYLVIASSQ
mgnify:CR=1 FL=1